jgi:hypothetical protein
LAIRQAALRLVQDTLLLTCDRDGSGSIELDELIFALRRQQVATV